jgi:hypothetical protein
MNKKTNTLLFILAATVLNIFITIAMFLVLVSLFTYAVIPRMSESTTDKAATWAIPLSFIGAITASFVVYRILLKLFIKKVNIEKYFDPIFGSRRPPIRRG